jgi:hypothetical protein
LKEDPPADELHIEVALAQGPIRRFSDQRKGSRNEVVAKALATQADADFLSEGGHRRVIHAPYRPSLVGNSLYESVPAAPARHPAAQDDPARLSTPPVQQVAKRLQPFGVWRRREPPRNEGIRH